MNYLTLGTNNLSDATNFYDQLFADQNIKKWHGEGRMIVWRGDGFIFAVAQPFDQKAASVGNGSMVGFYVESAEKVAELYHRARALGATCAGAPGMRSQGPGAYVRDLDGNKLCFYSIAKA